MGEPDRNKRTSAKVKALLLVIFIIAALAAVRFTPAEQLLTADRLGIFLQNAGLWAPAVFVVIYTLGVCLFVPGTVLGAMGAVFFGTYWGFVYVWIGAMAGASAAFFIGRYLGRELAASMIGDKLKKYDDAIERNGFATVLYLRLICFPFTPMNFGMGLTKVHFRDYFFGTGLGIFSDNARSGQKIGTLKAAWVSGNWGELLSAKVTFSMALFIFSLFIPQFINRFKQG